MPFPFRRFLFLRPRRLTALVACAAAFAPGAAHAAFFKPPVRLSDDSYWTNYLVVADVDGDGDLDVVVPNAGGFVTANPSAQPFQIFVNNGQGTFTDGTAQLLGGAFNKAVRQVALGDIDGDGDLDLYVPDAAAKAADKLFVQVSPGHFVDQAATRLGGIASTAGAARFGDFDGDGDLDLLVLNGYVPGAGNDAAALYRNDGTGTFSPSPLPPPALPDSGSDPYDVDLLDVDGDFDLDVLINRHSGRNVLLRNNGNGTFVNATTNVPQPGSGSGFHYDPGVCDIDGDGDIDVLVDNTGGDYREQILANNGSGVFSDVTNGSVTGNGNIAGLDDNGVGCADVNGDGHLDLVVASLSSAEERVLLNNGQGVFTLSPGAFPAANDATLWIDFGDLDGDGRLDAVTGQGEGGQPWVERVYIGAPEAPVDTVAPKLRAVQSFATPAAGAPVVLRYAVSDSAATDVGPRLQRAFVRVTANANSQDVTAHFVGGDLFYATLPGFPAGTSVTYQACATDQRGNEGCAPAKNYVIAGGEGGSGGSSGAGGSGGTSGTGGFGGTGGAGGEGGQGGVGGTGGSSGSGGGTSGAGGDSGASGSGGSSGGAGGEGGSAGVGGSAGNGAGGDGGSAGSPGGGAGGGTAGSGAAGGTGGSAGGGTAGNPAQGSGGGANGGGSGDDDDGCSVGEVGPRGPGGARLAGLLAAFALVLRRRSTRRGPGLRSRELGGHDALEAPHHPVGQV